MQIFWGLVLILLIGALQTQAATSPYPFRPGYGIGSWVPPAVIKGLKMEAAMRSRIVLSDKMGHDAESVARELMMANHPIESESPTQTIPRALDDEAFSNAMEELTGFRKDIWSIKLEAYTALWQLQRNQLEKLKRSGITGGDAGDAPSTFAVNIASPVVWALSELAYMDRGFSTISINSHLMKVDTTVQTSDSQAHSRRVSQAVKKAYVEPWAGNMAQDSASQAASKTNEMMKMHTVEYTLLLTSIATHNKVKQFKSMVLDCDKVLTAWNFYHPKDRIVNPNGNLAAFIAAYLAERHKANQKAEQETDTEGKIALMTESFLGSSFTGMVHFIQRESTSSSQSVGGGGASFNEVSKKLRLAGMLSTATGSTETSRNTARQLAALESSSELEVTFDMVVQGYIPSIKSSEVQQTVSQFGEKFDPSKMGVGSMIMDAGSAAGGKAQNVQQSSAETVIKATMASVGAIQQGKTKVLDINTFMNAFDNYCDAAQNNEGVGIPAGMNVDQFKKIDVMNLLADKYVPRNLRGNIQTEDGKVVDESKSGAPESDNDSTAS